MKEFLVIILERVLRKKVILAILAEITLSLFKIGGTMENDPNSILLILGTLSH